MTRSGIRSATVVLALLVGGTVIAGCSSDAGRIARLHRAGDDTAASGPAAPGLTAFADCRSLLDEVAAAAGTAGPGIGEDSGAARTGGGPLPAGAAPAGAAPDMAAASGYSGTNTHEAGADEPDVVKTDGHRIVTVTRGTLRVVDAAGRRQTGSLDLAAAIGVPGGNAPTELLLSGDHALVLLPSWFPAVPREGVAGPQALLALVDVSGSPRLLATYRITGGVVDARQSGRTARVVVRSGTPDLAGVATDIRPGRVAPGGADAPGDSGAPGGSGAAGEPAGLAKVLPRYSSVTGGRETSALVPCRSVYRPARYSGTAMLTVLTFDLAGATLGDGQPVSVLGGGGTVYGTGDALYVAGSRWAATTAPKRPTASPATGGGPGEPVPDRLVPEPGEVRTAVYRFETSGTRPPRYTGSGEVPGYLINQYAMSEWGGDLRIATTREGAPVPVPAVPPTGRAVVPPVAPVASESAVYVLRPSGDHLDVVGQVGGLGRGERIRGVRFVGPTGYVVTFRQTDPLYTLDLRDPRAPRVAGELALTGYSAYLHPAGSGRLIGVGQEATQTGRQTGTQVSLFDVADPASPRLLSRYQIPQGRSEAETDPHAFLYWPATATLVVPVGSRSGGTVAALVLGVADTGITERGTVTHPGVAAVHRSLVIDGTLWTLSDAGLRAVDLTTLAERGWLAW